MERSITFRSTSSSDYAVTQAQRKQRVFRKTRTGCEACKIKKVKCDEAKPVCLRCQRNSRRCRFPGLDIGQRCGSVATPRHCSNLTVLSGVTVNALDLPRLRDGISESQLLNHCTAHWSDILQFPYSSEVVDLFKSDRLIRSTILAAAAGHLRFHSPETQKYRIAECFQLFLALRHFREALETPLEYQDQDRPMSLLISATLLKTLAFAVPPTTSSSREVEASESWVFSTHPNRLGWMALQAGLRPLILSDSGRAEELMEHLGSIFIGSRETRRLVEGFKNEGTAIPTLWEEAFYPQAGSWKDGMSPGNAYRLPLTVLANLRLLAPSRATLFLQMTFMSKWTRGFRNLVFQQDQRAIWLVGYWLGLMRRFEDVWWCHHRAFRDYSAICLWLSRVGGGEGVESHVWAGLMDDLLALGNPGESLSGF